MLEKGEKALPCKDSVYLPRTYEIIKKLGYEPGVKFQCAHSQTVPSHTDPAIAIFEVVDGCVGLSDEVQPLCSQHILSLPDGAFGVYSCVIDLSVGGEWSLLNRYPAAYTLVINPETQVLELVELSE